MNKHNRKLVSLLALLFFVQISFVAYAMGPDDMSIDDVDDSMILD